MGKSGLKSYQINIFLEYVKKYNSITIGAI